MSRSIQIFLRALTALVAVLLAVPGGAAHAQGTNTLPAGASMVTYADTWEVQPDYTSPDNVFLMHSKLQMTAFAYLETNEVDTTNVDVALDYFANGFSGAFDPGTAHVVASGVTGDATAWRLYAATASGVPAAYAVTANVTARPGMAMLSLLMAPTGSFDMALDDAGSGIQIDGQPVPITAVDPAQLTAALEGDADSAIAIPSPSGPTTPVPTPATGQAPTSQPAIVDGVDYRQLDTATGCDRIGWAITDPSQMPATEADIHQRGACAGGVSYVAKCGTVPGERADQRYIACEITALVTDGSQEFAFDMFELFEADGSSEYIDLGMSFGNGELFASGTVPEDTTASGMAPFAIDVTAAEPLLLEIRPPSLPAGAEPAAIVIEGPLQPLTVFD